MSDPRNPKPPDENDPMNHPTDGDDGRHHETRSGGTAERPGHSDGVSNEDPDADDTAEATTRTTAQLDTAEVNDRRQRVIAATRTIASRVGTTLRRPAVLTVTAVLVVGLVAWGVVAIVRGPDTYRVQATFTAAPGLYEGNAVKVLGVRVGTIAGVDPGDSGVRVEMDIREDTTLPADVQAYLLAPNVVNDRYVALGPGYTGGPSLGPDGTIPVERTVLPQSVDQILASVDRLADQLGPEGANEDGSLNRLLRSVAKQLGGTGGSINASVKNLGKVMSALDGDTQDVTKALNSLGELTSAAAGVSEKYEEFAGDLAKVSSTLAKDRDAIAGVLRNLAGVLDELNTFVRNNEEQLSGTLRSLSEVADTVGDKQQELGKAMRFLPLAMQNAEKAVDEGSNSMRTRFNQVRNPKMQQRVCGDGVLRMLLLSLDQKEDENKIMDLACGANALLLSLGTTSESPNGGAFSHDALAGDN